MFCIFLDKSREKTDANNNLSVYDKYPNPLIPTDDINL